MMATVPHVTSGLGLRKFQADGFFWHECTIRKLNFFLNSWVCSFEVFEFLPVVLILRSNETWRHVGMSSGWEITSISGEPTDSILMVAHWRWRQLFPRSIFTCLWIYTVLHLFVIIACVDFGCNFILHMSCVLLISIKLLDFSQVDRLSGRMECYAGHGDISPRPDVAKPAVSYWLDFASLSD